MGKRVSTFRVKRNTYYTTAEAAKALGMKEQTVQRWVWREGLKVVETSIPRLILGRDLIDFVKNRNRPRRVVESWQFLCLKCQLPRDAAFGCVEIRRRFKSGGAHLTALCPICCTVMLRFVDRASLAEFEKKYQVTNKADPHAQNDSKNDIVQNSRG